MPAVIHDREAHADVINMLSKFKERINAVMHCFSGSREMAEQFVKSNFYISFAEPVTFPNARKLQGIAKRIDLNNILVETDSPWLAPQQMRGRRNEPAFLPFIAEKTAQLKGISVDQLVKASTDNAKEIFRLI